MARYISEEDFIQGVEGHYCTDCDNYGGVRCRECWIDDAIGLVEKTPTADVVPKSEVERLEKLYNDMTQEAKGYLNRIYGIRADVAREIFEEISKASVDWGCYCVTLSKGAFLAEDVNRTLTELKKKYTEGEPNGN